MWSQFLIDDLSYNLKKNSSCSKLTLRAQSGELLRGAQKTLAHTREIIMEYHSAELLNECRAILNSHGFECKLVKPKKSTKKWLLGYILLNSRMLMHGLPPAIVKLVGSGLRSGESEKIGILHAKKISR
jgi:hypothetical protein